MRQYWIPFSAYVTALVLPAFFPIDKFIAYSLGILITGALLFYFRRAYKLKIRLTPLALAVGFLIFSLWISLDGFYPKISDYNFNPPNTAYLIIKFIGSVTAVALVEELFTRGFLPRYLSAKKWEKFPIGKFNPFTFSITVLFFGLSHNEWLPALISGALLNLLLIKERSISSTIIAHGFANLLLGIYTVYTNSWHLW